MPPDDDSLQRIAALESKIARLEEELAAARSGMQRAAVQQTLMDDRLFTLERNRLFRLWEKIYRAAAGLYARIGSGDRYGGVSDLRTPGDYARWVTREQHEMAAEDHRASAAWPSQPRISVLLTGGAGAVDSARSVLQQCYANWELCVPASLKKEIEGNKEIQGAAADTRVRMVENAEPSAATGDFTLLLTAGDRLSPHALHFYAQALQDNSLDILYADEDWIDDSGNRTAPLFKPCWSPELLRCGRYPGRAILYRRGAMLKENSRAGHISRVLYHRAGSAAPESGKPQYIAPADARLSIIICSRQVRQVRECLEAIRKTASLSHEFLVVHHLDSGDGKNMRQCVERFGGSWIPYRGPFDFSRMNNLAAHRATAPALLFLNDDVRVHERGWDQALAATLARAEIGAAGTILQYPNGTVQHAGVVVGMGDGAGHCGRFQMTSELWPWLRISRDVTAVTGAMLGMRSGVFKELGGFDEAFPVNYNDVDLCLRVRKAGLRVVCLDVGKVVHRESQTRVGGTRYEERDALYKRWAEALSRPDEFYSIHLEASERIALKTSRQPLEGLGDRGSYQ